MLNTLVVADETWRLADVLQRWIQPMSGWASIYWPLEFQCVHCEIVSKGVSMQVEKNNITKKCIEKELSRTSRLPGSCASGSPAGAGTLGSTSPNVLGSKHPWPSSNKVQKLLGWVSSIIPIFTLILGFLWFLMGFPYLSFPFARQPRPLRTRCRPRRRPPRSPRSVAGRRRAVPASTKNTFRGRTRRDFGFLLWRFV